MKDVSPTQLKIEVGQSTVVSALLVLPEPAHACFVFAHGAGPA
jgi:hypothetical protein